MARASGQEMTRAREVALPPSLIRPGAALRRPKGEGASYREVTCAQPPRRAVTFAQKATRFVPTRSLARNIEIAVEKRLVLKMTQEETNLVRGTGTRANS